MDYALNIVIISYIGFCKAIQKCECIAMYCFFKMHDNGIKLKYVLKIESIFLRDKNSHCNIHRFLQGTSKNWKI